MYKVMYLSHDLFTISDFLSSIPLPSLLEGETSLLLDPRAVSGGARPHAREVALRTGDGVDALFRDVDAGGRETPGGNPDKLASRGVDERAARVAHKLARTHTHARASPRPADLTIDI